MTEITPKRLSFILSTMLSMMTALLFIIFEEVIITDYYWLIVLFTLVVLFVIQYLLLQYALERFIYSRIKLVYKAIHKHKLSKDDKKENVTSIHGDIIGKVNTEVENWSNEREEEIDELRKMEIYRREFLGNVSHELKTPLFNIQGFVLTLMEGGINDPEVNLSFLQKSQNNIERMITIVEDLEVISRLETGEADLILSNFSITQLITEVMEFIEPKAIERNIKLVFAAEYSNSILLYADKEKIRTVITNLIDNSIKYGTIGGRTKVSLYDMDENYLIEISDNGVGIEEKHISRLFERFYRIDKHRSRAQGGSGLGLAIVKHIIEAHSQTINVRSTPGFGSTFSFTLQKSSSQ